MSSPATRHTVEGLLTEAPARPATTPAAGGPCACRLLTALVRVRRLVDEQPAETLAADDLSDQLERVRESIDAAQRHAEKIRAGGGQAERACPDDLRRGTRLTLDLDVIHDGDPEELLAVLVARVRRLLTSDEVDVEEVATRWVPT